MVCGIDYEGFNPVRFEILNVEHGFCAYAVGGDGGVFLFDCGHGSASRPSFYLPALGITSIRRFFVTNYDEDHISDLLAVRSNLYIEILTRNASLTSAQIRLLKAPPISPAMNELLLMIDSFTGGVSPQHLEPLGLSARVFYNSYPAFTETNNLSLLIFLDVGGVSFVIPGDLQQDGWLCLLGNLEVRRLLARVNIFIASHHGRENGYCKEVFDYCKPSLIVMSDSAIEHDTQKMASVYSQHAQGQWFNAGSGQQWRKVVTTRNDGNIYWDI